ncbi:hypothetical protein N0V90_007421 [Kalmusia sp. IMI 367209]|nr:hypothetical protein N0V90_007421 [Kalmusia sp. IMI 367209]
MARARGKLHNAPSPPAPRRSSRRTKTTQDDDDVPKVFQDLLSEQEDADKDAPPPKKRKTRHNVETPVSEPGVVTSQAKQAESAPQPRSQAQSKKPTTAPLVPPAKSPSPSPSAHDHRTTAGSSTRARQTIIDSDESDDSDMEWEDALAEGGDSEDGDAREIGDISITFGDQDGEPNKGKRQIRRRAITAVDKKRRLDIHKVHIMCLLYHVHRRNTWCNDRVVQSTLLKILPSRTLTNFVPNPDDSQYQASKRFIDGMNELKTVWSKRFTATAQGMYKPRWAEADAEIRPFSDFDELDDPMDLDDFRNAASKLQGSQDVGAQLFCALIRGIGMEARLVCSLQCLPFASAAQPASPQKPSTQKNTITLDPYDTQSLSPSRPKGLGSSRRKRPSRLEQAIGERHPALSTGVAPKQRKKYHTAYPVYWIEAFNSANQKWVPVDPLSTFTVGSSEKLEPPLNSTQNTLSYAVAFDIDYTAKDVTRRYAKAYNAKTRKFRVESTHNGSNWWKQVMKFFKRKNDLDKDQVEDAALAQKEAREGIPKNVQDFKDHPVYVLERHLRHNEVIYPLNQVGKVNVGSSMNPKMEPIYRRKDVHLVRSADKWYRLGRDVQDGEQPLKHAKPKKNRRLSVDPDMDIEDQQDEIGAGLYAEYQTELYVPPPVVRGRVPRNAYGNLDLYVPSMCPPGGYHIRHKLASKAARIVGVDFAEAVTGFKFKGRHGTAIVQGVVVAQEYAEAVEAVIDGMEYAQQEAEYQQRKVEALRLWRRFYLGLKIAQRINAIEIDGKTGPVIDLQDEMNQEDKELTEKEFAGGFFPDEGDTTDPPARRYVPSSQHQEYAGVFVPDEERDSDDGLVPEDADHDAGGFRRQESQHFGSTILSQQQLLPRRQSSFLVLDDDEYEDIGISRDPPPLKQRVSTPNITQEGGFIQEDDPIDLAAGLLPDVHLNKPEVKLPSHRIEPQPVHPDIHLPKSENASNVEIMTSGSQSIVISGVGDAGIAPKSTEPSSSPSDAGSLPLEDPDDEDAEPDWLVDVT